MAIDNRRLDANGLSYYFQEVGILYDEKFVSKTEKRVTNITLSDRYLVVNCSDGTTQKYNEATQNEFGVTKIYSGTGNNVDGTMTQKAISDALSAQATEMTRRLTNVYHYKGSVNAYSNLPTTGIEIGDVYNIVNADATNHILAGDNVAWNGSAWDNLSGVFVLPTASTSTAGITKIYTSTGSATDGTMTQKAITDEIIAKTSSSRYGVCSTAAGTAAKVVTVSGTFILSTGSRVAVKFTNVNSVAKPTLNVNNTGEKYIYANGHQLTANSNLIVAGGVYDLVYDGTNWEMTNIVNVPKEAGITDFYTE